MVTPNVREVKPGLKYPECASCGVGGRDPATALSIAGTGGVVSAPRLHMHCGGAALGPETVERRLKRPTDYATKSFDRGSYSHARGAKLPRISGDGSLLILDKVQRGSHGVQRHRIFCPLQPTDQWLQKGLRWLEAAALNVPQRLHRPCARAVGGLHLCIRPLIQGAIFCPRGSQKSARSQFRPSKLGCWLHAPHPAKTRPWQRAHHNHPFAIWAT